MLAMIDQPEPAPSPVRLLVVEDDDTVRTFIVDFFSDLGCTVTGAAEAEEAGALLEHRGFDAMITDLELAGLGRREGLDVLGLARHHCPDLRIVVFTGDASPAIRAACLDRGADEVLAKPLPLAVLAGAVLPALAEAA
jgi:two-component system OmpR family response regulator